MAQATKYLKKIRGKKWSEPLGDAMSVTASIADALSALGVPFAGILGGAAKMGSAALNPAPSLADLKRTQKELEDQIHQSTGIVKDTLEEKLDAIKEEMRRPQSELVQDINLIKTEIQNTATEMVEEMKSIEKGLELTKKLVHQTYDLVVDIRYKDGVERIDSAFKVFVNGARNLEATFSEMQGFIFEMQTAAEQAFSPQSIKGYLTSVKVTNDVNVCQSIAQYIVITEAKYLQMMIAYLLFTKDFDRAASQFKIFNQQYEAVTKIFKEVLGCEFKPNVPPSVDSVKKLLGARPKSSHPTHSGRNDINPIAAHDVEDESADYSDDEELENLLKEFKISNLYSKFRRIGVTSDILWDVSNKALAENGFDEFQIMRFSKARNKAQKAPAEQSLRKIGSIKDVYRLEGTLGQGSFGIVYRAKRIEDGLICAVKRIPLPVDERKKQKFEREAKTLNDLDHRHIVKSYLPTYRFEEGPLEESYMYLTMELCKKETLDVHIRRLNKKKQIIQERVMLLNWFCQLCDAVQFIHGRGYSHRDIKPSNVFFDQRDNVKLGDFGLVTDSSFQTQTTSVGTRLYSSPEQLEEKKYGTKTDIFPLGLILYECIHPTATDEAQLYLILKNIRSRQFPATFKESKSENILIKKMLSPSQDNRPSANDVLKTIKGFLEPELPASETGPNPPTGFPIKETNPDSTFNTQASSSIQISTPAKAPGIPSKPNVQAPNQLQQHSRHTTVSPKVSPSLSATQDSIARAIPDNSKISLEWKMLKNGLCVNKGTVLKGVLTERGAELWSDYDLTLDSFPEIVKGSYIYPVSICRVSDSLEIKIHARCSCQLMISESSDFRAWDEGELQSIGFTSIPGEIKTSGSDMSKIYLKHLKPDEKLDLPITRHAPALAIFVK